MFYSISSTQKGLAGVDLGHFLIKQVAQKALAEFPGLRNLVTLSPIPGFRSWLHTQLEAAFKQSGQVGLIYLLTFLLNEQWTGLLCLLCGWSADATVR